jgi:glycosyltransferase involved in cell wall biosynthesis
MMRVVAYMPTKNEEHRYLHACLRELTQVVDEVVVYDDQSTDNTPDIAESYGCRVAVRPVTVPSFLQHEGRFRQAAYDFTTRFCEPGDWIVAVDADEFVGHPEGGVKDNLYAACANANSASNAILIQKHEVFGFDEDGTPLVRVDGFWGQIIGTRLFRYLHGGVIADKAMGSGCEPTYVNNRPPERNNHGIYLLHYGYATGEDQVIKHERYSSLIDHGHNDRHIQSIVQEPQLKRFEYPYPEVAR